MKRRGILAGGVVLLLVASVAVVWRSRRTVAIGDSRHDDAVMEAVEVTDVEGGDDGVSSNLVVNGSFEQGYWFDIPAWRKVGAESPGIYAARGYKGANTTDGRQALDVGVQGMGGGNVVSQAVPTMAGVTYSLSFDWGSEYAWGVSGEVLFQDSVTNITQALEDRPRVIYPKIDETPWIVHRVEQTFRANGPGTLTFRQIETGNVEEDFGGLVIDNVVIEPRH